MLRERGVTPETLQEVAMGGGPPGGGRPGGPGGGQSSTPTLHEYGRDLTEMARNGQIDPVIGREAEIEQTVEVLSRRRKNNPVLIGEAGVGKTSIVEGIAAQIIEAVRAAVELSDRYIPDRHLPDKAIDLIDQAGARVRRRVKTPPTDLRGLEQEVERLQREKDQAVAPSSTSAPSSCATPSPRPRRGSSRRAPAAVRPASWRSGSRTSPRWCPGPSASRSAS